jgi:hypothetical protein
MVNTTHGAVPGVVSLLLATPSCDKTGFPMYMSFHTIIL